MSLAAFSFNSCEKSVTLDVPGPDIEFNFDCSSLYSANLETRVSTSDKYKLIATSDTIYGKDIEEFLSDNGQEFSSVVETATMYDADLTLSEGHDFTGIDSMQIRYEFIGSSGEIVLASGSSRIVSNSMQISNITVSKTEIFELVSTDIVAKLYAKYDQTNPNINCFDNDVTCKFTAKTTLNVKLEDFIDKYLTITE